MMRKKASKKVIQSHVHQEEVEAVAVLSTPRTNQAKKVIPSHDLQEAAGISITILLFRFFWGGPNWAHGDWGQARMRHIISYIKISKLSHLGYFCSKILGHFLFCYLRTFHYQCMPTVTQTKKWFQRLCRILYA